VKTLLLINPNTSAAVTDVLLQHVQAELGNRATVHAATAAFGASYIASEASYALATHATIDSYARFVAAANTPDAVLIGCFGDPGLFALRALCPAPVSGLAQAAFHEAARHGQFAIVTAGEPWRAILTRHLHALGCAQHLAGIRTLAQSATELAADPQRARALLVASCQEVVATTGARSVILGGAGLAGVAATIAERIGVPVIDSVRAGARHALDASACPQPAPDGASFSAVSPPLLRLLGKP
jgi:Asp/Glu/hydantoin racemase